MKYRSLVAVDPSLTCSGWAFFTIKSGSLLAVGKIQSLPPKIALAERFRDLQAKIVQTFQDLGLGEDDVLVCESQTTMKDPKAAFKVEQVRGIFETVARANNVTVPGRLNPRSVQNEVLGLKGKQLERIHVKAIAVGAVKSIYGDRLEKMGFPSDEKNLKRHQDIVDALLIGSLALSRISTADLSGVALEELLLAKSTRAGKIAMR